MMAEGKEREVRERSVFLVGVGTEVGVIFGVFVAQMFFVSDCIKRYCYDDIQVKAKEN